MICPFGFYVECPYDDQEDCVCFPDCIKNERLFDDDKEIDL